jgi:hypothetical protein
MAKEQLLRLPPVYYIRMYCKNSKKYALISSTSLLQYNIMQH